MAIEHGPRRSERRLPRSLRLLAGLLTALIVTIGLLWLVQRRLVFLPDTSAVPPAAEVIDGALDVTLTTADGVELGAWYVPGEGGGESATVLVANGNAGNRASRAPLARALAGEGLSVLLFDYRGYGGNPGSPSETGLGLDVAAARSYLVDELGVDESELIYFGESLGTGVVSALATEHPPAGMLLRSPFTDLPAVAQRQLPLLPVRLLMKDRFPVEQQVARLDVELTVVLGTADSLVPPDQSRAVARAGDAELVEVDGVGHNDRALFDGAELIAAVVALVERTRR
jgi:pimeloyl-ACP methyl ester carboxylesterase